MSNWPFMGMACDRPYPTTGLTTARWKSEVAIEVVQFDRLTLTQAGVDIFRLFNEVKLDENADDYPHVVVHENVLYLEDGHHRAVRAALQGKLSMEMRVFRDAMAV